MTNKTVQLPSFGRTAELRSSSYNEEDNTIDIIWTTGASVRRYSWWDDKHYNEILEVSDDAIRLERLNAGAPFLDTHDSSSLGSVLGSVVRGSARIENGIGIATVKLSNQARDADIVGKIRDGIIVNISVGYRIHKVIKESGQEGDDEDWRVVDWEPLELSAVPIPADAGAQIRAEGQCSKNHCEFETSNPALTRNMAKLRLKLRHATSL